MGKNDQAWLKIFDELDLHSHAFDKHPFFINADQIKQATKNFTTTTQREVRILCKQDTRTDRPDIFQERNLFILPVRNGEYVILQGEGYVDIPPVTTTTKLYISQLDFDLVTSQVGNSEMQHLDYAYATSMLRTFMDDKSLLLTIRGRKYTPQFEFFVGANHHISVESVQTEVDAGYEGKEQIVLVEAKQRRVTNTIIRQLYYPFRQWNHYAEPAGKQVCTIFFEKTSKKYTFWQFVFDNPLEYNSIRLARSAQFELAD